jgi:mannan endo-1,4-beta-mannosidase
MDIYEDKGEHNSLAGSFSKAKELFKGKKMVALSENGGIPDPAKLVSDGAYWSWFCTWYGAHILDESWNSKSFIKSAFNHELILTRGQFKV